MEWRGSTARKNASDRPRHNSLPCTLFYPLHFTGHRTRSSSILMFLKLIVSFVTAQQTPPCALQTFVHQPNKQQNVSWKLVQIFVTMCPENLCKMSQFTFRHRDRVPNKPKQVQTRGTCGCSMSLDPATCGCSVNTVHVPCPASLCKTLWVCCANACKCCANACKCEQMLCKCGQILCICVQMLCKCVQMLCKCCSSVEQMLCKWVKI